MKIRAGFVSNSSSSSFVLCREFLNKKQEEAINLHIEKARVFEKKHGNIAIFGHTDDRDKWKVMWGNHIVTIETDMDNFDMPAWLDHIGVPIRAIDRYIRRGIG